MKATQSQDVTYTDAPPLPRSGRVNRSYFVADVFESCVRVDAGASQPQREEARAEELRLLGRNPAPSTAPRVAPAGEPAPEPPPKSPARQARDRMYEACFREGVHRDEADALAAEIGLEQATRLIEEHGQDAAWTSMTSTFWRGRGVTVATPIARTTPALVGGERAAAAYKRRAQALMEPGRARESAVGSDASGTYQRREVAE